VDHPHAAKVRSEGRESDIDPSPGLKRGNNREVVNASQKQEQDIWYHPKTENAEGSKPRTHGVSAERSFLFYQIDAKEFATWVYCRKDYSCNVALTRWWPNRSRVSRSRIGSARTTAVKRSAGVVFWGGVTRSTTHGEFVFESSWPAIATAAEMRVIVR